MSTSHLTPYSKQVDELSKRGFTHQFVLAEDTVIDVVAQTHYVPEQMTIVEERRAEGDSDPADSSVVLALRAPDGVRGTMSTAYGPENEYPDTLRRLGTAPEQEGAAPGA